MDRFSSAGLEKMPILDILLWSGSLCGYWLGVAVVGGCVDLQTRSRKEDPMCQFLFCNGQGQIYHRNTINNYSYSHMLCDTT